MFLLLIIPAVDSVNQSSEPEQTAVYVGNCMGLHYRLLTQKKLRVLSTGFHIPQMTHTNLQPDA